MARHRKKPSEEPVEGNFDMLFLQLMMLMMAFFILLSSLSVVVEERRQKALNSLAGAFNLMPSGANLSKGHGQSIPSREIGGAKSATKRTAKDLTEVARLLGLGHAIHVLPLDKSRVVVRMEEQLLFGPGEVHLRPHVAALLNVMTDILKRPEIQTITIEGHTDESPTHGLRYASNWELSAARAMQVFRALAARGVPASHMIVAGMGDTRPLPASQTHGNAAINRRVELLIRFRPTTSKNVRMVSPRGKREHRTSRGAAE